MSTVQAAPQTLAQVSPGRYVCERLDASGMSAVRLKRLGICEGRPIELVGRGDPMVLRIGESRIGLSRQVAALVHVRPAGDPSSPTTIV